MMKAAQILLLFVAAAGSVGADEIYKWTDDEGNVHYGDRPVADDARSVELVAISSSRTNPTDVDAAVEARKARDEARAEARTAREEAEEKAAEERKAAEEQVEKCNQYRATLEKYVTSRRLYKLDASGERVYLDDAQMQQERSDLQKRIQDDCTG